MASLFVLLPASGTDAAPLVASPALSARSAHSVTAYVVNSDSDTVTPIQTATNTAGTPVTVGPGPVAIAITPDGKTAYVLNSHSGTVTPIQTATNTAGTPITVGTYPWAIVITP